MLRTVAKMDFQDEDWKQGRGSGCVVEIDRLGRNDGCSRLGGKPWKKKTAEIGEKKLKAGTR